MMQQPNWWLESGLLFSLIVGLAACALLAHSHMHPTGQNALLQHPPPLPTVLRLPAEPVPDAPSAIMRPGAPPA